MEMTTDTFSGQATAQADLKIKIIGVGGAGTNAVDGLKLDDLGDVRLAFIKTIYYFKYWRNYLNKHHLGNSISSIYCKRIF